MFSHAYDFTWTFPTDRGHRLACLVLTAYPQAGHHGDPMCMRSREKTMGKFAPGLAKWLKRS